MTVVGRDATYGSFFRADLSGCEGASASGNRCPFSPTDRSCRPIGQMVKPSMFD
jgi:hypothetical protein